MTKLRMKNETMILKKISRWNKRNDEYDSVSERVDVEEAVAWVGSKTKYINTTFYVLMTLAKNIKEIWCWWKKENISLAQGQKENLLKLCFGEKDIFISHGI